MGLYWNPLGALGLSNALAIWALAAAIYLAAPQATQNRRLAVFLSIEAAMYSGGAGWIYLVEEPHWAYAAQTLTEIASPLLIAAYLSFLATLETPSVRPLRARGVLPTLWVVAVLGALFVASRPGLVVSGVEAVPFSRWESVPGPYEWVRGYLLAASFLFGLLVALSMWLGAPQGSARRARGRVYALAFGIRDVSGALVFTDVTTRLGLTTPFMEQAGYQTLIVGFYLLLAYGILRHQLFDIDLKLKWTIRRGTVAAAFVAVFFAASELAQSYFAARGGLVVGIVAAAALVFALQPLHRFADRISDAAMPNVRDTEEYRLVKKREVYRAAVESAAWDGTITERERDVLATLQEQLGIRPTEARALERDVLLTKYVSPGGA
ncbi:MAG: hypothetical protein ACT4PT_08250 [Methanobacteriota archaeon]